MSNGYSLALPQNTGMLNLGYQGQQPQAYDPLAGTPYAGNNQNTYNFGGGGADAGRGFMGNFALAGQGLSALGSTYLGYKNYQQGKQQFDIENKYSSANLYNAATLSNADALNRKKVGLRLGGIQEGTPEYDQAIAETEANYVKTSI